jgi:hypothetical protein
VETSCEHGNKLSGSIKCSEILEIMSDCRLLMEGSAPWSQLIKEIVTLYCENRTKDKYLVPAKCRFVILSEVVHIVVTPRVEALRHLEGDENRTPVPGRINEPPSH